MGYIHFFDDWQLISRHNLERKQGKPKWIPEATLVDGMTEGTWNFPLVTYDPNQKKYIGLYGAAATMPDSQNLCVPFGVDRDLIPRTQVLCYAESKDGINWTKPDLTEKTQFDGPVFCPNQVFGLSTTLDGGPPTYDPYEKDPEKRYKYLINFQPKDMDHNIRALVASPDGIHWKIVKEFRDQQGTDTPTSIFYHPGKKTYVFNVRKYAGDRRIFFLETRDWEAFTEPELIMHPDSMDPPLVGFYGMPFQQYENLYIGLLWKIYCDPNSENLPNGPIDCELVYSYDGNHFNRTTHQPFIERPPLGEHGGGCLYTGSMLVTPENEVRFYSGGSKAEHFQNQQLDDAALMMHQLRLDGFMYLATHAGRGRLRTRALYIRGPELKLNVNSPYGGVRVQILDEKANVITGFSFDDCTPFLGNELFHQPTWKNGKSFKDAISPKRRQIEIEITTGEMYAIRGDFELLNSLWQEDGTQ